MSDPITYPEGCIDDDVLDHAADILERRGRCKGELTDGDAVCVLGAIGLAVGEQWHGLPEVATDPIDLTYPDQLAFDDAVIAAIDIEAEEYPLPDNYEVWGMDYIPKYLAWTNDNRYPRGDVARVARAVRRIARYARGEEPTHIKKEDNK